VCVGRRKGGGGGGRGGGGEGNRQISILGFHCVAKI